VKCGFDVTIDFPNLENFAVGMESVYDDIRKFFGVELESELNL